MKWLWHTEILKEAFRVNQTKTEELNKNPAEPEQEGRVQNTYFVLSYCENDILLDIL